MKHAKRRLVPGTAAPPVGGTPLVRRKHRSAIARVLGLAVLVCSSPLLQAASPQDSRSDATRQVSSPQDGSHDFDFHFGVWHTRIRRVQDPFSPSSRTIELEGTVTVRKLWGGKANLEEIEADGANGHWEGMTLFLYNPDAHEWSQNFANSRSGVLQPPMTGSFKNGQGELIAQDTLQNKSILVKGVWSTITAEGHHYDELYSRDGGQTWVPAFSAVLTRQAEAPSIETAGTTAAAPAGVDQKNPQHAFDWDLGTWNIHMSRLSHPLTGSTTWNRMDGVTVNSKVWGGRANIAEVTAKTPGGDFELLALRLYNPESQEWTTSFATSGVGVLNTPTGRPTVGTVREGRLEFYDQEPYNGRSILVRFRIGPVPDGSAASEQAFSDDGGKTWETNWINKYTRRRN